MQRYYSETKPVIVVRTATQAILFQGELKGQLSDGHWENSRPMDHWRVISKAEVKIGDNPGLNFRPRRGYNFANKDLLDVVAPRMLGMARVALNCGYETAKALTDIHAFDHERIGIEDFSAYKGEYWDKKRAKLAQLVTPEVLEALKDETYGMSELRKDLKALGALIREARR